MKFLLDISKKRRDSLPKAILPLLEGQLQTPNSRYKLWSKKKYGIDNGSFIRFNLQLFQNLIRRHNKYRKACLFVTCPDVVGSGRRTLEIWKYRRDFIPHKWPLAFVCQDGMEDLPLPWDECQAIFIGGTTRWKESDAAAQIVKAAKILGKHVHIGRINTKERFEHFIQLGADTCDGSGLAKYDHMTHKLLWKSERAKIFSDL